MDLNFLKGIADGEQVANSENTMKYVVMKTLEGDITFTYEGDNRLDDVFKDYENLGTISQEEHQTILNIMNTCEWDLKVDIVDGKLVKIEKYTAEEKAEILTKKAKEEEKSFFNSEKRIALAIEEDYRLGLEEISEEQILEVKTYMKSIQPKSAKAPIVLIVQPTVARPQIMEYYDSKDKEGLI
ncbi:MAG: hypothetical protein ACRCRT_04460 [Cetobacterium somerae]